MKRIICSMLVAVFVMLPCRQSPAPIPVVLALTLKCIFVGGIGATAIVLIKCETPFYLYGREIEGEDPYWYASQETAKTALKTGGRRWQGPLSKSEAEFRAWANNRAFSLGQPPMFGMGPLGTVPGPVYTNYTIVSFKQSLDGGNRWRDAGSMLIDPGESNGMICLLGPNGTNGMTHAELQQVAECDEVIADALPVASEIKDYQVSGYVLEIVPVEHSRERPAKQFGQVK